MKNQFAESRETNRSIHGEEVAPEPCRPFHNCLNSSLCLLSRLHKSALHILSQPDVCRPDTLNVCVGRQCGSKCFHRLLQLGPCAPGVCVLVEESATALAQVFAYSAGLF